MRYDSGNRATPSSVRRANVPARWMRDQHRHAIGRSRGNADAFDARDQRITFFFGDRFREVGAGDIAHPSPMHLSLLEQTVDTKPKALGEAGSVFANGAVIVTQVEAQVEAVVRCGTHPAQARRKRVAESVLIQKSGMQGAHLGLFSTLTSGRRRPRAVGVPRIRWASRCGISVCEASHLTGGGS